MFASVTDSRPTGTAFGGQGIFGLVEVRQQFRVAYTALLFAIASITMFVPQQVCAQTPTYPSSDQTADGMSMMPTPGGHDYEHLLSETVTFASGQLSYRLQYPMPKGRGISSPYWFGYSSAGLYRLYLNAPDNSLTWAINNLSFNGANPVATWQVTETPSQTFPCGPPGSNACQTWPCYVATGFTFYGPDGTNHNIGLYSFAPVGTPPPTGYYGQCAQPGSGVAAPGADGEVSAQFVSPSQEISSLQSGYVGQFTVTDKNGTTYFFAGGTSEGGVYVGIPTQIEDRNGNIINTGSNGFVDTLGRTVATGNNGIAQTIGGIAYPAPTPPAGAPSSVSVSYSVPNSTSTAPCFIKGGVNINTVTGSQPAWSGIPLPDGTQYTLFYGSYNPNDSSVKNNYGLVNEVIFPGGGWIKYQWAINSSVANEFDSYPSLGTVVNGVTNPCYIGFSTPELAHRYVSYDGTTIAQQQDFTYTVNWNSSGFTGFYSPNGWTSKVTKVVTTDKVRGNSSQVIYTYVPGGAPGGGSIYGSPIPVEQTIQYFDIGNTTSPMKTVTKAWNNIFELACEATTVNGLTTGHLYQYLSATTFAISDEVTDDKEYAYTTATGTSLCNGTSGATLARETKTTYQSFQSPIVPYNPGGEQPGAIFFKPQSIITQDGSGNPVAETDYSYDQFSLSPATGIVQHDDSNYGTNTTVRGNVTTITKRCIGCTNAVTTLTYDQTGQVVSKTDPCGNATCTDISGSSHTTTYSYTDSPSGGNAAGPSNAYLTSVTYPQTGTVVHNETFSYNYVFGYLTTSNDENSQPTVYKYNTKPAGCSFADNFQRLTEVDYPDGGVTTYCYNDAAYNVSTPSPSVTTTTKITSGVSKTSVAAFDGMGHTIETLLTSDPDGTDYTNITYDGMGKVYQGSNPHRTAGSSTDGTTTHVYDGLGRTKTVTEPDGSIMSTTYDQLNGTNTVLCTTVTDESGKSRQSCANAQGQMTGVWEDPGSSPHLNYETDYGYDVLNNLLSVTQKGGSTVSSNWRPRTFQYDSLSRLTQANNPESGTIQYTYDANSNLSTKTAPSPNQNTPTNPPQVTTSYLYDDLNRLMNKSYADGYTSNPPTPNVSFGYDGVTLTGCTVTPPGDTDTYPIGLATSMCDGSGGTTWTHDKMGRVIHERRAIGKAAVNHYLYYSYNLDGSLKTLQTPPMKVLNYTVLGAGRATQLIDSTDNINFALSATYAPPGELTGINLGSGTSFSGFAVTNAYNARLQPILLSAASGTSTVFSECYDFHSAVAITQPAPCSFPASTLGNNGNVYQIVNNRSSSRSQTFTYDVLNRIASGQSSGTGGTNWGEAYTIDAWGNLTNENSISGKPYSEGLNTSALTSNQLSGFGYDSAGNMTSNGLDQYIYDAENHLIWTAGYRYSYDGNGARVEKCQAASATTACPTSGTTGMLYWRGTGSETLAETDLGGNQEEEYIFFNGQRIARRDVSSTGATVGLHYYFSDHLGTHAVVESVATSGAVSCDQDIDYYPYGGQQNDYCAGSGVTQNYKFNGKERDTESGLDNFGARYDTSSLGRFMTPDWAAKPTGVPYANFGNPQSLNLYSYVENNPTTMGDPDGHAPLSLGGFQNCEGTDEECQTNQQEEMKDAFQAKADAKQLAAQNTPKPASAQKPQKKSAKGKAKPKIFVKANSPIAQARSKAAAQREVDYHSVTAQGEYLGDHKLGLTEKCSGNCAGGSFGKGKEENDPALIHEGEYEDLQLVWTNNPYTIEKRWSVDGQPVQVLDPNNNPFDYEVLHNNANADPPFQTEYKNDPPN